MNWSPNKKNKYNFKTFMAWFCDEFLCHLLQFFSNRKKFKHQNYNFTKTATLSTSSPTNYGKQPFRVSSGIDIDTPFCCFRQLELYASSNCKHTTKHPHQYKLTTRCMWSPATAQCLLYVCSNINWKSNRFKYLPEPNTCCIYISLADCQ